MLIKVRKLESYTLVIKPRQFTKAILDCFKHKVSMRVKSQFDKQTNKKKNDNAKYLKENK